MFSLPILAQDTLPTVQYYYVEEKNVDGLKPTTKTRLENHSLDLTFANTSLQSFFDNKTVYVYKKAFPGAINKRLQNMYLVGFDDFNLVNPIRNLGEVVYVDYIGTLKADALNIPNDYFTNVVQPHWTEGTVVPGDSFEHLDLINAPMAWNITTGNQNIHVGVIDLQFHLNHLDVDISNHYGTLVSDNFVKPHGLRVAGAVAAETNNGIGISAIGYDTSLITLEYQHFNSPYIPTAPHPFDNATTMAQNALFLVQNHPEIKVINYSLKDTCDFILANELAYEEVWDTYGVTVVAAAGNGNWLLSCTDDDGGNQGYIYPASYDHVISVGAVSHHHDRGFENQNGVQYGWKDVFEFFVGNTQYTLTYNDKIDLVAPGYNVPLTTGTNSYIPSYGTSYASPIVAGTAALMYAANPSITPDQVKTILRNTAEDIYHIPENQPYIGLLGTGRLNAYAAVKQAYCLANPSNSIDLMTRNSELDYGQEPDSNSSPIWESQDIWVRNQNDGFLTEEHQDPEYVDANTPVYVYVRVTNDGCTTSSGNDELKLYWAKGGLNQTWPNVWDGSNNPFPSPNDPSQTFDIGDEVGTQTIPALETGESTILEFEWYPKSPEDYENAGFNSPWMFCFLSRILSDDDLMSSPEVSNAAINAENNNNIAYKNTTVINVNSNQNEGSIFAGNLDGEHQLQSSIQFFTNNTYDDRLWQEAEVYTELDESLWSAWQDSGAQQQNTRVVNASERRILIAANNASLDNINFDPQEIGTISLSVNFLVREVDDFDGYDLQLQQTESTTNEVLGGFSYTFTRNNERQYFTADNEVDVENDNSRTLRAIDINEPAVYNWYDEEGNLIYSGNELSVNTAVTKEYKLEVIAQSDGHKDYHTIVTEDIREILSISPNPAQNQTTIKYFIDDGDTAIIMLTNTTNGSFFNYVLDSTKDSLNVDLSNLVSGQYIVNLISGNQVLDTKNLIIN